MNIFAGLINFVGLYSCHVSVMALFCLFISNNWPLQFFLNT